MHSIELASAMPSQTPQAQLLAYQTGSRPAICARAHCPTGSWREVRLPLAEPEKARISRGLTVLVAADGATGSTLRLVREFSSEAVAKPAASAALKSDSSVMSRTPRYAYALNSPDIRPDSGPSAWIISCDNLASVNLALHKFVTERRAGRAIRFWDRVACRSGRASLAGPDTSVGCLVVGSREGSTRPTGFGWV